MTTDNRLKEAQETIEQLKQYIGTLERCLAHEKKNNRIVEEKLLDMVLKLEYMQEQFDNVGDNE